MKAKQLLIVSAVIIFFTTATAAATTAIQAKLAENAEIMYKDQEQSRMSLIEYEDEIYIPGKLISKILGTTVNWDGNKLEIASTPKVGPAKPAAVKSGAKITWTESYGLPEGEVYLKDAMTSIISSHRDGHMWATGAAMPSRRNAEGKMSGFLYNVGLRFHHSGGSMAKFELDGKYTTFTFDVLSSSASPLGIVVYDAEKETIGQFVVQPFSIGSSGKIDIADTEIIYIQFSDVGMVLDPIIRK